MQHVSFSLLQEMFVKSVIVVTKKMFFLSTLYTNPGCVYFAVRKKNGSVLCKSDALSLASAMDTLDFFHKQTLKASTPHDGQCPLKHRLSPPI